MTWISLPYVFLGGGLGASLRWGLALYFKQYNLTLWGSTLVVNALGTLLYFLSLKGVNAQSDLYQHFFRFGLLGALTTFSTFSYEVASAAKSGHYVTAASIFFLNIFAGVLIAIGMIR